MVGENQWSTGGGTRNSVLAIKEDCNNRDNSEPWLPFKVIPIHVPAIDNFGKYKWYTATGHVQRVLHRSEVDWR